jgi:alpha-1,3-mannosyl-glycoprotein beta-1,2-N-acetylglucosaminyltransferase
MTLCHSDWDDWLRDPQQRKDRQVIRPEISRTYHFGSKGGTSHNKFGEVLEKIRLNTIPVDWEKENLSYLESSTYEVEYQAQLMSSMEASSLNGALTLCIQGDTRLSYRNFGQFEQFAKVLNIMQDEKATIPRTAYNGIVEARPFDDHLLFLYPSY